MAAGLSVGLTACGDDEPLRDTPVVPTPEPDPKPEPEPTPGDTSRVRTLAITADWREALDENTIPAAYSLWIGTERHTADARNIYRYTDSLSAGPYALVAYNEPEGITITGLPLRRGQHRGGGGGRHGTGDAGDAPLGGPHHLEAGL